MSKVKHDGWGYKYRWSERIYPPIFHDKATLIRKFEYGIKNRWRNARRAGTVKAVKVRIVEVEEEMTTPEYKSDFPWRHECVPIEIAKDGEPTGKWVCLYCHKPTTVRKEEGDEGNIS